MGVCKPEHINGTLAGLMAQALDKKDGKVDKQINAKEWNIFIDGIREKTGNDKLGKKINNSISLENAIKSITTYACKNATADKNGTAVARKWVKDLGLEINIKKAPAAPVEETPATQTEETPATQTKETSAAQTEETPAAQAEETTAEPVEETPAEDVQEFSQPSPYVSLEEHPEYASSPSEPYAESDRFVKRAIDSTKTKERNDWKVLFTLHWRTREYDKDGNIIYDQKIGLISGKQKITYYDKNGKKTHTAKFDSEGNLVKVKTFDRNGKRFDKTQENLNIEYDKYGQVKNVWEYASDNEHVKKRTEYYTNGEVKSVTEVYPATVNVSKTTDFYDHETIVKDYSPNGELLKETEHGNSYKVVTEYSDNKKSKETTYNLTGIHVDDYDLSTGKKSKETCWWNDGCYIRDYASDGNLSKYTEIYANGSINRVSEYDNGVWVKTTYYSNDNSVKYYSLHVDESRMDYYNADNVLIGYYDCSDDCIYDNNGNKVESVEDLLK